MNNFFMKKYGMSEKGASNLSKAICSRTILNLTKLFPPMVAFLFIFQYLGEIEGIPAQANFTLVQYVLIIVAMLVIMFIVARWDYKRLYTNVYMESSNIRIALANRLKKLPLSYFEKRDLTDIAATVMEDITLYETMFSHAVPQLYATIITTLLLSMMILSYHLTLGIAMLWVIPVALLIAMAARSKQKQWATIWNKSSRDVFDDLQENIEQIAQIKSYNLENKVLEQFYVKLDVLKRDKVNLELILGVAPGIAKILLKLGIVTVALVGVHMVIAGEIDIIVYISFLIVTSTIYLTIEEIITYMTMLVILDSVVSRIKEINMMPIQEGKTEMYPKNYDIEFKDVHFGYEDYSVINGVSFKAKQGEVTALIGESGSGKSTLAKLAARFWDVDRGCILIGGEDISSIDPETLLQNFSIVFQEVVLFNASIKDNIKIGKKDASDEEIIRAAKAARCDEFIDAMPDGIDTVIGENGQKLSGGERQRISIARAILKDAPIILMDEATASLDVENESLIQDALSELIKDKTVVVIAHRLRTVRNADRIVLLKDGRIEAMGTDEELCKTSTYYKELLVKSNVG